MISDLSANIIGILGSILIVAAYAYNVYAAKVDPFVYNGANLVGAGLLDDFAHCTFQSGFAAARDCLDHHCSWWIVESMAAATGAAIMIIAIDGPTASGKGTISRELAAHFQLPLMDTGLLYRAVGWTVREMGGDPDSEEDALKGCIFEGALLSDPVLRSEGVGAYASKVSIHPTVRQALNKRQKTLPPNREAPSWMDGT